MKLSLLRHGESVGGRIYRGNQDDPLTDKGWQQMLKSTHNQTWQTIYSSPLQRCQAFAQHLKNQQNTPLTLVKEFEELGFGDWQGLSAVQIGQASVDEFKRDPLNHPPKNAENLYAFQTRVLAAFNTVINSPAKSTLIIAHAGVIRVIKSHLLNLPIEKMFIMQVVNASCENFEI